MLAKCFVRLVSLSNGGVGFKLHGKTCFYFALQVLIVHYFLLAPSASLGTPQTPQPIQGILAWWSWEALQWLQRLIGSPVAKGNNQWYHHTNAIKDKSNDIQKILYRKCLIISYNSMNRTNHKARNYLVMWFLATEAKRNTMPFAK